MTFKMFKKFTVLKMLMPVVPDMSILAPARPQLQQR
jgi:hypothetical protein